MITNNDCSNTDVPVLGGLDVMMYWTDFKGSDGVYDETKYGTLGSPEFTSSYNGYQFNFVSAENQQLFETNPSKYAPQFGGFCAWGIGGEFCPSYSWAADCLGPSGDWGKWTVHNEKLYFFFKDEAKEKFAADPDTYAAYGEQRWGEWFPSDESVKYSTKCFVSPDSDSTIPASSSSSSSSSLSSSSSSATSTTTTSSSASVAPITGGAASTSTSSSASPSASTSPV